MKKHTLFITVVMSLAVIIGIWKEISVSNQQNLASSELKLLSGTTLPKSLPLPDFEFTDQDRHVFNNDHLNNYWSFLFFGYTKCPEICPTTLNALAHISQRIGPNPYVQYLFVSITPEVDTPQTLSEYFSQDKFKLTNFKGLSGDMDMVKNLADELGIYVEEQTDLSIEHIGHSGAILLLNPKGELTAVFTSVEKPHRIAHDFKEIMAKRRA